MKLALSLLLSLVIVLPATAAQEKKKRAEPINASLQFITDAGIELTAEQKTKVDELKKEYGPKLTAAVAKRDDMITKEQRKARKEATDAAKTAGKKGKELRAAGEAALKLSDEDKKKYDAADKEVIDLQATIRTKATDLLTAEQKAKVAPERKKKNKTK